MGDGLFHDAGRLDHLRQEHLAGAEQVANVVHAGHQRAFDDGERGAAFAFQLGAYFLSIGHSEICYALDQGIFEAFFDRLFAPRQIGTAVLGLAFLHGLGELDQRLACTSVLVEHHVLDLGEQFRLQVVIDAQHAGVHDAHGHAVLDGMVEEDGVDRLAYRVVAAEGEGDVRHAAGNVGVRQVLLDPAGRLDEIDSVVVVFRNAGGDGEDVRVEDDVFGWETDASQQFVRLAADFDLAGVGVGLAFFVKGHDDYGGTITAGQRGLFDELGFAFLHRDRIDDTLALDALQAGLDDFPLRRVDHDRHAGNVGFRRNQLQKLVHGGDRIEHRFVHVDVDDLGAVLDLLAGDGQRVVEAAFEDHAGEGLRAGDVGPLADVHVQRIGTDVEGFQPGQAQLLLDFWHFSRADRSHPGGDRRDVLRRGAAAAADDIDDAALGPALDFGGQLFRRLVVAAEGIGQAGIRVGRDVAVADAGQFLDVLAQFLGAERAVQAEGERLDVVQRIPESFGGLAGQRATGGIGNGARDHHRPAALVHVEELFDGKQRRLGVECVKDGFNENDVSPALDQPGGGLNVIGDQFVEGDVAVAGVVDVRRDRRRAAGRAEHAGDEARLGRVGGGELIGQHAGQAGAFEIQFVDQLGQVVVGLRDGGRVEGAGLEDIGAGFQVFAMEAADDVGPGQDQQVVVALDVVRVILEALAAVIGFGQPMALDHGAHGAVEDEQALLKKGGKFGGTVGLNHDHLGKTGCTGDAAKDKRRHK